MPKCGCTFRQEALVEEIRRDAVTKVDGDVGDLEALKKSDIIKDSIKRARVILSGEINKAVTVKGLKVTKGALAAIEAAGGKVEE